MVFVVFVFLCFFFFFFKQKTAYEILRSDWSSDVCSSDLFKRDADTGEFRLIEVNPRSWSWVGITAESGVSLPWLAYADLAPDESPGVVDPPRTQTVDDGAVTWIKPL